MTPKRRKWSVGFKSGVHEQFLASHFSSSTQAAVIDWISGFTDGPPNGSGLVFGSPRHPFHDPEYWSARLNTDEGLVEVRFTVMEQRDEMSVMSVVYLGPPPPIATDRPRR